MSIRQKSFMAAFLAALTVSTSIMATSAQAYQCKSFPTQAYGIHKLKMKARGKARKNWSASVLSQFGLPWSLWKYAEDKSVSCYKSNGKHHCLASGDPCKYVVF